MLARHNIHYRIFIIDQVREVVMMEMFTFFSCTRMITLNSTEVCCLTLDLLKL